jgi:hypothetical protein
VLFLAGTGFFALTADGREGIKQVEAALEFGGNCEIDVVVARGGVYAMAGVYVSLRDGRRTSAAMYAAAAAISTSSASSASRSTSAWS